MDIVSDMWYVVCGMCALSIEHRNLLPPNAFQNVLHPETPWLIPTMIELTKNDNHSNDMR
jgi:hypothetical protein